MGEGQRAWIEDPSGRGAIIGKYGETKTISQHVDSCIWFEVTGTAFLLNFNPVPGIHMVSFYHSSYCERDSEEGNDLSKLPWLVNSEGSIYLTLNRAILTVRLRRVQ